MLTLKDFYKELQQWLDEGKPVHAVFNANRSMCVSYTYWLESKRQPPTTANLTKQFAEANLDFIYPFNPNHDFWIEMHRGTVWENQARLQWVKQHAS